VLFIYFHTEIESFAFTAIIVNDSGTRVLKIFLILVSIYVLAILKISFFLQKLTFLEFFSLFLISILSSVLLLNANDLILIFLLIEMQAMSFYILACFKVDSIESAESGLKYVLTGAFISGIYLFGSSLIYGIFGTVNLMHLNILLLPNGDSIYY